MKPYLLLLAVAVLVPVVSACGAEGTIPSTSSQLTLDPQNADELARRALPTTDDLPGGPWQVGREDTFDNGETPALPRDEACAAVADAQKAVASLGKDTLAGAAQRQLGRNEGAYATSVDVEISIYRDAKPAADAVARTKRALDSGAYDVCFRDVLGNALVGKADATAGSQRADPHAAIPLAASSAASRAWEVTLAAAGERLVVRFETYTWRWGNARATVRISGEPERVTAELVAAAVAGTQERMEAAAR